MTGRGGRRADAVARAPDLPHDGPPISDGPSMASSRLQGDLIQAARPQGSEATGEADFQTAQVMRHAVAQAPEGLRLARLRHFMVAEPLTSDRRTA